VREGWVSLSLPGFLAFNWTSLAEWSVEEQDAGRERDTHPSEQQLLKDA